MKYILLVILTMLLLLVILTMLPYFLFPLGILAAVLTIRHFILKRKGSHDADPAKKRIGTVNTIMLTSIGITAFRTVWDYIYLIILRPDLYALTSFSWYTNSLLYGAVTLVVVLVCLVVRFVIKHRAARFPAADHAMENN